MGFAVATATTAGTIMPGPFRLAELTVPDPSLRSPWVVYFAPNTDVGFLEANGGATGGGVSSFFSLPPWQEGLTASATSGGKSKLSKRGVPDVSGDADPATGYDVRVDGSDTVIGGTSAVAPLWAGLVARIKPQGEHL